MKRRSDFTIYKYTRASVYEYKRRYFVMQESQQGQNLLQEHGSEQRASTLSGLVDVLEHDVDAKTLGAAALKALNLFDVLAPPYGDFDFPARNKFIKKCMNARGMKEWETNQRMIDVQYNIEEQQYIIRSFDNNNINPWIGPQGMPEIKLGESATAEELGRSILAAFQISTYSPNRTDPK
jgi:hypothetical protein